MFLIFVHHIKNITMTQLFLADEQLLRKVFREELAELKKESNPSFEFEERMDRRTAAKFLGVSYQCMYNWTKDGKIKEHGNGRTRFYFKSELIEAISNK
jgi:hypothetical protein